MAHIRQQALLGSKERFEPFQSLVERADHAADLIVIGTTVGNASGEIVGAVDLFHGLGDGSQRLQGLSHGYPNGDAGEQDCNDPYDRKDFGEVVPGGVNNIQPGGDLQGGKPLPFLLHGDTQYPDVPVGSDNITVLWVILVQAAVIKGGRRKIIQGPRVIQNFPIQAPDLQVDVERSIARYLRERGYTTLAFFPHEGNFYNARRAYEHYGFQVVRDSKDLGHEGWMSNDLAIVESVKASLGAKPRAPFLAYVLLLENHAPHACGLPDASSFRVHFSDSSEFEPNCALHEYLRRQDSTTAAVRAMRQYLADLEARTGRPFVLLVFGDHQPHTFTTTGGIHFDYAPMRRNPDARNTFFHFQSSAPSRLRCCKVPPPATVLPTLLSSVARSPHDVYLGESLWLYSECGSNAIRWQFGVGMVGQQVQGTDDRTQACKSAYRRALASFRAAGVVHVAAGEATGG